MAQQTVYANNPPPAVNGQKAGTEGEVIWSKIAEGVAGVPVGLLAAFGTKSMSVPAATTPSSGAGQTGTVKAFPSGISDNPLLDTEYLGIPLFDAARMAVDEIITFTQGTFVVSAYAAGQDVPVMRKGRIWVLADAATTQGNPAYVYVTAQTNNPLGQFGAASGTGKVKFSRGRWAMTTTAAGLSLLEVSDALAAA